MTSVIGGTKDTLSTLTSRTGDSKKWLNLTPDKGHMKNLFASSPLRKDPIHWRENSEPHGYKTFYTGSDNYFTDRSHDEENIENYKFMDELSNKDTEHAE